MDVVSTLVALSSFTAMGSETNSVGFSGQALKTFEGLKYSDNSKGQGH